jgi:tetratricopeptide (TPR) repeat protein
LEFAAVSLLVARARAYKSDFTLTRVNAEDIVKICFLLDGLPLAIELAAARIKLFSPKAMVAQLHSKLAFLSSRARNLPVRQQTLRDTLDWSYHLLDDEEKRLFRRLALFRASFTAEAVAKVALAQEGKKEHEAMPDLALNLLVALSEKSMIHFGQSEIDGQPRFQMLSTVREYAMEALRQEKQPVSLNNRHALYFAGLAEAALEGLRSPEQADWVKKIREEVNNFQAALDWLVENNSEERTQFPLSYIIGEDKSRKGHLIDAVPYFELSLEKAKSLNDIRLITKCWNGLADLYLQQGDNHQALKSARQAEEFARTLTLTGEGKDRERLELVTAVTMQGWALSRLGEFDAALPTAERAVALSDESDKAATKLIAMNLLAYLYDEVGRYQDGAVYHQKAIAMARKNKDQAWEATLLNNLAESYKMMGNFEGALKVFDEAYRLSRLLGYRHIQTLVLVNAGHVHLELENIAEAEACFRQVLDEIGDKPPFFLAFCYALLGHVCAYKGTIEEGLSFAQRALQLAEELDNPEDIAYSWIALAALAAKHKDRVVIIGRRPYTPSECYEKSAAVFEKNGQEIERARLLIRWARYETAVGNKPRAAALLQEAKTVFTRFDLPLFLAQADRV